MIYEVFNGPKSEFEKRLPTEKILTLSSLVRIISPKEEFVPEVEANYEALVIFSDEYSGVADFFIEGFLTYSSLYAKILGYEKIIMQNPPAKVKQQLASIKESKFVQIHNYSYSNLKKCHLKKIKEDFEKIIFGQPKVKRELLASLYSLTNKGTHKPTVIMLYGPSSVGKTETAKLINSIINPTGQLFRKQLSMFHNEKFMNYIFGDKSNSFAKDLLDRETNIILLDEFDKAHPMFYSAFYQLFDEGIYTDKYYEVCLENTIIFCTSNYLDEKEIRKSLGDPIYSRFDHFISFNELEKEAKLSIIESIYDEEIKKFSKIDQVLIQEKNIKEKLKEKVDSMRNAREIRKVMVQTMSYVLIENL